MSVFINGIHPAVLFARSGNLAKFKKAFDDSDTHQISIRSFSWTGFGKKKLAFTSETHILEVLLLRHGVQSTESSKVFLDMLKHVVESGKIKEDELKNLPVSSLNSLKNTFFSCQTSTRKVIFDAVFLGQFSSENLQLLMSNPKDLAWSFSADNFSRSIRELQDLEASGIDIAPFFATMNQNTSVANLSSSDRNSTQIFFSAAILSSNREQLEYVAHLAKKYALITLAKDTAGVSFLGSNPRTISRHEVREPSRKNIEAFLNLARELGIVSNTQEISTNDFEPLTEIWHRWRHSAVLPEAQELTDIFIDAGFTTILQTEFVRSLQIESSTSAPDKYEDAMLLLPSVITSDNAEMFREIYDKHCQTIFSTVPTLSSTLGAAVISKLSLDCFNSLSETDKVSLLSSMHRSTDNTCNDLCNAYSRDEVARYPFMTKYSTASEDITVFPETIEQSKRKELLHQLLHYTTPPSTEDSFRSFNQKFPMKIFLALPYDEKLGDLYLSKLSKLPKEFIQHTVRSETEKYYGFRRSTETVEFFIPHLEKLADALYQHNIPSLGVLSFMKKREQLENDSVSTVIDSLLLSKTTRLLEAYDSGKIEITPESLSHFATEFQGILDFDLLLLYPGVSFIPVISESTLMFETNLASLAGHHAQSMIYALHNTTASDTDFSLYLQKLNKLPISDQYLVLEQILLSGDSRIATSSYSDMLTTVTPGRCSFVSIAARAENLGLFVSLAVQRQEPISGQELMALNNQIRNSGSLQHTFKCYEQFSEVYSCLNANGKLVITPEFSSQILLSILTSYSKPSIDPDTLYTSLRSGIDFGKNLVKLGFFDVFTKSECVDLLSKSCSTSRYSDGQLYVSEVLRTGIVCELVSSGKFELLSGTDDAASFQTLLSTISNTAGDFVVQNNKYLPSATESESSGYTLLFLELHNAGAVFPGKMVESYGCFINMLKDSFEDTYAKTTSESSKGFLDICKVAIKISESGLNVSTLDLITADHKKVESILKF